MEWIWTGIVLIVAGIVLAAAAREFTQTYAGEHNVSRAGAFVAILGVIGIIVGIWVVN